MQSSIDRTLMQLLLLLSSSDGARLAASAWLAAFDAAQAAGAPEDQAHAQASEVWRKVVQSGVDARPPPSMAG